MPDGAPLGSAVVSALGAEVASAPFTPFVSTGVCSRSRCLRRMTASNQSTHAQVVRTSHRKYQDQARTQLTQGIRAAQCLASRCRAPACLHTAQGPFGVAACISEDFRHDRGGLGIQGQAQKQFAPSWLAAEASVTASSTASSAGRKHLLMAAAGRSTDSTGRCADAAHGLRNAGAGHRDCAFDRSGCEFRLSTTLSAVVLSCTSSLRRPVFGTGRDLWICHDLPNSSVRRQRRS